MSLPRFVSPVAGRFALALALVGWSGFVAGVRAQSESSALQEAARVGDVDAVKSALEGGAEIDAADRYGATALYRAAVGGHLEVVRLLLSRGADASVQETFWGQRAIDAAFGENHYAVVAELVSAGAEGREDVFEMAMRAFGTDQPGAELMAKAAITSGPFFQSRLDEFGQRSPPGALAELLKAAESRADLPPPVLSASDLEPFAGVFEGWSNDQRVEAAVAGDNQLRVSIDGADPVLLRPVAERVFASEGGVVRATYFGRFGSIEGIFLGGTVQGVLRRSVAEPTVVADTSRRTAPRTPRASTVHWPSFRGAGGSGVGDGREVPVRWNTRTGKNVLWSAPLDGLGNSSPVIWGNRVYLTTAVASGVDQKVRTGDTGSGDDVDEAVEHSWQVLAFDKTSGEQVWSHEVYRGVPETRRHFKASQANSTPATNGDVVVAVFPTAGMVALDRNGKRLWHHDLGPLNASSFFSPEDQWGFASSPIIYGDSVILQVDVYGGGYLAAWRLSDGKQLWKTERDVATSWSTPTVLETEQGPELVVNAAQIRGYDPRSGEKLWSLGPNSELVIARPVVGDGVVFVSAGYAPVKPVYAIRAGLRGDLEVTPGSEHGALVWSHRVGGAYMPSPLLYDGLLYIVHHNGRIVAYEPATGNAVLKSRFSRGGTFTGSPVANNGRLFIPTEGGLMYVLQAGGEYTEIAVNEFDEPLMASPAISEGVLYVRTPENLYAIGTKGSEDEEL